MRKTSKLALYGVMTALAMILSFVESQIPAFVAVPGVKIGLTNIAVLVALYILGDKGALAINFVRIVAVALLFGNAMSLSFSLAGGMLATIVMILLKKLGRFSATGVSIAGGLCHNLGQIIMAMIILNTKAIFWYLPVLWLSGVLSGFVIGIIGALVIRRIPVGKSDF
ncbi:Gx transporter family protein [Butyrivibrio sp. DSM 10294]|uniref:Gx transporter family protein n=1 Tax=Butyrivibrio sp. DSM 10294 TaxID=2972457 RepID=UPI00234E508C|nr:Gx transporter family protein [Butyrivibrio sp. DSM 10294]MDC7294174.1 Gx transporter family protein [Butyrivibrio sp. DSM 10294]